MMKRTRTLLPATRHALTLLGTQIAAARREAGWTAAEIAERVGCTPALIGRIERGEPGTAVGTVLEVAVLCGVPLFNANPRDLPGIAETARLRLALLPARVRTRPAEVDDNF